MKLAGRLLLLLVILLSAALLVFIVLRHYGAAAETASVVLPAPPEEEAEGNVGAAPSALPQAADVTPETVWAVLQTLSPVRNYSRAVIVDTFWEAGSGTELLLVWARGDSLRLRSDGEGKNLLATAEGLWVWYDDAPEVFSAPAADRELGRYQRILSWETLVTEDAEIAAAAYTEFEGERCIYAAVRSGAFDYVTEVYVSLESGLLVAADSYEGEKCVYRMRSGSLEISTPEEKWFSPPGTN